MQRVSRTVTLLLVVSCWAGCSGKPAEYKAADFRLQAAETGQAAVGTSEYLDAKNGFRGFQFGSAPEPSMKVADTQDYELTQSYTRPGEDLEVGAAEVREIRYVYYDDELTSIIIETGGEDDSWALREELQAAYGPKNSPDGATFDSWNGERVMAHFIVQPSGDARVTLWSRPIMEKLKAETKAKPDSN